MEGVMFRYLSYGYKEIGDQKRLERPPYNIGKNICLKDVLFRMIRGIGLGILLLMLFHLGGRAQCPYEANVDSVHFDDQTGETTFYLWVDNPADSIYVWFGDGTELDTVVETSTTFTIDHRYSLDSRDYSSPYSAYFYLTNRDTSFLECYGASTDHYIYFQNKNCQVYAYVNSSDSLKASFNIYSSNSDESFIHITLKNRNNTLDTFSITYNSYYTTPTYSFPKAGYDTLIIVSQGDYCSSTDTLEFYVQGYPCSQPTLVVNSIDSVQYQFNVTGANTGSVYSWELYGMSWDTTFETSASSFVLTLPNNDRINVWVYAYDPVNNCYSNSLDTLIVTGTMQCYAYFYYYETDTVNNTFGFYNYSAEGKKYLWDFGDGTTSTSYDPGLHTYTKVDTTYTVSLTVSDPVSLCVQRYERRITVGSVSCLADFTYSISGQTVTFTDKSTGAEEVYWDFGDDYGWSYDYNPSYTYSEPGIYEVYLWIWNYNCYNWTSKTITVGDISTLVKAGFNYYYSNDTVYFSDDSRGNITQYYWTFGDGTSSSSKNVQKTYAKPGIYNVCLTVSNAAGKVSSYCEYVWAGEAACNVAANFSYRISKDSAKIIEFTNSSQGNYDSYYWDFGDGGVSMEASPIHAYAKSGYYWVSLTVYDSQTGCMDTYYETVQVGTIECKADFNYVVDASTLTVTLQNKSRGGENTYYYWWFDDGDYSELANPAPKTFEQPGKHYIGLVIYDAGTYCYYYTDKYIQVGEMACSAEFSYLVDTATNTIHCYNKSLGASTYLFWYFGDGSYSFESNPQHRFAAPGFYTVGLSTYDDNSGCMDYYEKVVQISGAGSDCAAEFTYYVDNETRTVSFFDNSFGNIVKYLWNFGDGNISNTASATNQYNSGGIYNVCLTVVNDKGKIDISCKQVKVAADANTDCQAKFIFAIDSTTSTVKFVSKSLGNPISYSWDFGDNTTDNGEKVTHQYVNPDYYLVSLYIVTANGCRSDAYALLNIGMPDTLKAAFAYRDNAFYKKAGGYPVDFIGAGLGDAARIKWTFGDGSTDTTTTTPTHVYSQPGTYEVCYEISDPITGAADKQCRMITVTGIKTNYTQTRSLEVYPLPFSSELNLKLSLSKAGNVKVVVTDLSGRRVDILTSQPLPVGNQMLQFNTANLKRGSYLLRVETPDDVYQQLIIKQ
ncbi:MAG TPA: PKD domain-containing protein [Bacteroidales bacterium]|nr:PKD domain-containing protein [Bacteroidales bacterium]